MAEVGMDFADVHGRDRDEFKHSATSKQARLAVVVFTAEKGIVYNKK
jgi:hypothetical protein